MFRIDNQPKAIRDIMSPKSMKMAAERKKPAMRAVKPMNAKKKRAVRMKPACRALEPMMATEGLVDDGSEPSKDDEIVELRVQVKCCHWELSQLRDELSHAKAAAAAANTKIAMLQEEKKKQVAIVPETGDLWVKAGDVVLAIKNVPGLVPGNVDRAKAPHPSKAPLPSHVRGNPVCLN